MQQAAGSTGQRGFWLGLALVGAVWISAIAAALLLDNGNDLAKPSAAPSPTLSDVGAIEAETFKGEGFSFRYPASWVKGRNGKGPLGGLRAHFESSGGEDVLKFVAEKEPEALYEADYPKLLEYKRGWLRDYNKHVLEEPAWRTVGDGIRALRYVYALENGDGVAQRDTLIFDGRMFYEFSCRFRSAEMKRNCDLLEQSFRLA